MPRPDSADQGLRREIEESQERYRNVTETSPDAIITAGSDGRIRTMNRAGREMFGYGPDIIGREISKLIPPHLRHAHRAGMERYLASGVPKIIGKTVELSALKSNGSQFPIEMTLSAWQGRDGVAFGAIIRDISERKRVEAIKEDVARMIRHDLRSPLVGITGLASRLARAGNLDQKQQKTAATIADLGQKMLAMIERSRDFYQLEEGTYQLMPRLADLAEIAQKALAQLEPQARGRGVRLAPQGEPCASKAGCPLLGDPLLLENMLVNLVKNAIEASPRGGRVALAISPGQIEGRPAWRVEIHNQGEIPPQIRARFFEAYVTAGKKGGSGLGTHNAWLAARAHGGQISFTTSREDGTRLSVLLPAAPRRPA